MEERIEQVVKDVIGKINIAPNHEIPGLAQSVRELLVAWSMIQDKKRRGPV